MPFLKRYERFTSRNVFCNRIVKKEISLLLELIILFALSCTYSPTLYKQNDVALCYEFRFIIYKIIYNLSDINSEINNNFNFPNTKSCMTRV